MSGGATYTGAETISSGYMGIRHMVHETTNAIVVGGEMDGRTLSDWLTKGKPVEGEIYVVATSSSQETLVASTEASAQAQLRSASNVDPGSVGGLTGSSAQMLQSQLGAFASLWLHSETVTMADSHGLVSQRCPSSAATAYVAIASKQGLFSSQQPSALQRLNTTSNQLQLMMVTLSHLQHDALCALLLNLDGGVPQVSTLKQDLYTKFVFANLLLTLVMAGLCIAIQVLLAYLPLRRSAQLAVESSPDTAAKIEDVVGTTEHRSADEKLFCVSTKSKSTVKVASVSCDASKYLEQESQDSKDAFANEEHNDEDDQQEESEDDVTSKVHTLLAFCLVLIFTLVTVLWTILVSTNHRCDSEFLFLFSFYLTISLLGLRSKI